MLRYVLRGESITGQRHWHVCAEPERRILCVASPPRAGELPGDNQPPNHGATDLLCAHRPGRGPGAHTGCGRRGNDGGLQASAQNRLAAYACAVGVASWHRAALQSRQRGGQVGSLAPGQGSVRSLPLPSVSIKVAAQRQFHMCMSHFPRSAGSLLHLPVLRRHALSRVGPTSGRRSQTRQGATQWLPATPAPLATPLLPGLCRFRD